MSEKTDKPAAPASPSPVEAGTAQVGPVVAGGRDRVAMLSVRVDGTPDQTDPVLVGDPAVAREATVEQLVQKAVSDADDAARTGAVDPAAPAVPADPGIAEAKAGHERVAAAAAAAAESLVDGLAGKER